MTAPSNHDANTPETPETQEESRPEEVTGTDKYPVPTNYSKHLWLLCLIVLVVLLAAVISWTSAR